MNYGLLVPNNKFTWTGLLLMLIGFLTLPLIIGLFLMPAGILLFVYGVHKAVYDLIKKSSIFFKNIFPKSGK